jgi:wobble nucleotide-excising tRNase
MPAKNKKAKLTMFKKLSRIDQFGIFKNFTWDTHVLNPGSAVQSFVDINIIYGRNYSGKTTLSRIMRALETGNISDKYDAPSFRLNLADNTQITQHDLTTHGQKVRVFNEDFIKDNLRFITNPDDNVEPFAILGDDNNKIEKEISALNAELGSNEAGKETGLYADGKAANTLYVKENQAHQAAVSSLESHLSDKATNKKIGIKYKPERFGDQNYNIQKIKTDIEDVKKPIYQQLDNKQVTRYEKLISEAVLPSVSVFTQPPLGFQYLSKTTEKLITKPISASDKIEALVKDAVLNRWVDEGRKHHRNKHEKCAFCDNSISQDRWQELDKHFDEESAQLEKDIDALISTVETEKNNVFYALTINKALFYSKFHEQLDSLSLKLEGAVGSYIAALDSLISQLNTRKAEILHTQKFVAPDEVSAELCQVWAAYETIRSSSDSFTKSLSSEQTAAKKALRLKEVADYIITIGYDALLTSIADKKAKLDAATAENTRIAAEIRRKEALRDAKRRELNDEEKGAKKVNEYLNNFFGHQFLTLEAKTDAIATDSLKRIRFEVIRDGKKAYHLSEGERSLLAFCYFLAKLDDIDTRDSKPIIWIDDPISSLDGNHIFFVYSLLNTEIVAKGKFAQLFVSTHSLNFLQYLKQLKNSYIDQNDNEVKFQKSYFVVVRQDKTSTIQVMPLYLKKYVTEFNYLFHQIYKCSRIEVINDSNYTTFYNFANNARKFFEVYLYYKYPDQGSTEKTLKLFFGEDQIPAVLTDRINNEYSHLCGVFERGAMPVEVPEMVTAARLIIERLKQDSDQFTSLLNSVGETAEVEGI